MSRGRAPTWPALSLRITKQGKPQGLNDDRYGLGDLLDQDVADIAAGRVVLVEVRLMSKEASQSSPREVETCSTASARRRLSAPTRTRSRSATRRSGAMRRTCGPRDS